MKFKYQFCSFADGFLVGSRGDSSNLKFLPCFVFTGVADESGENGGGGEGVDSVDEGGGAGEGGRGVEEAVEGAVDRVTFSEFVATLSVFSVKANDHTKRAALFGLLISRALEEDSYANAVDLGRFLGEFLHTGGNDVHDHSDQLQVDTVGCTLVCLYGTNVLY
jgi:hypothetical protein